MLTDHNIPGPELQMAGNVLVRLLPAILEFGTLD
jgi:hypothetical protein